MADSRTLLNSARKLKMLIFDVDGVMTDGGIYYSASGAELKRFNAQDGYGLTQARQAGLKIGLISGRTSEAVVERGRDIHADEVLQGIGDKLAAATEVAQRQGVTLREMSFMGDDLFDLPLLKAVGLSAAPANARPEVRKRVHFLTKATGGEGAVREFIDLVLRLRARS
ncbi:MAG: KdsC family phosphatase [Bacteroidota bacterium]